MKTIVCRFNLFDKAQRLSLLDDDGSMRCLTYFDTTENDNEILSIILSACNQNQTNKVHLFGQSVYVEQIKKNIQHCEKTLYNKNELEIEVN